MGKGPDLAISVEDLTKSFADLKAVDGVSLSVQRGEIFGLLGPNGSGKTTLIHCLMGIYRFEGGSIRVLDHEVPGQKLEVRRRTGFMPQEISIYQDLSPEENMLFYGRLYGLDYSTIRKRTDRLFEFLDLEEKRSVSSRTLSGGQRRRVSLGIALLPDPALIILDEPTVGVDPLLRKQFWDHFQELKGQGKTILITTHITDEALRADRVALMIRGKILALGRPGDLMEQEGVSSLEDLFLRFEGGT
ncbi:MAG: putative branched-chain amino acid transport ATP-binding protein LivG [Methanomassiliicoccales archaeon PtaB.Bin134]|nr:MAG: putative branched-chain amino acid transport ATP-binding protein LivG [Methanomassiliicoccales archaeon PtaB.Bin134]